jgi:hypothetical protein
MDCDASTIHIADLFSLEPVDFRPQQFYIGTSSESLWTHLEISKKILHLEAWPIRCVRGLKSSFVIGQKVQIGPNSFTPRDQADLVVWFF